MKLFNKKNNNLNTQRRPERTERLNSAPIVRYYRPQDDKRKKSADDLRHVNTDPKKSKIRKVNILKLIYQWFGVLAILFIILANTTISGTVVKISKPSGQNNTYKSLQTYSEDVNKLFNSRVLNRSKFSLSSTKLEKQIQEYFPEVEQVSVIIPLAGRQLQVGLRLAEPLARLQFSQSNKQAVLSESGVVIELQDASLVNSTFSSLPIISIPNVSFSVGDNLLTSEESKLVALLKQEFDGSEPTRYKVVSIEFDVQKREIKAKFEGVNLYAKLTPERDSREQVGSLVATLKSLSEQGRLPQEYIDVRVEDRVFVK